MAVRALPGRPLPRLRPGREGGVSVAEGMVRIGQITAPHGVRGEVRVYPLTAFPERWHRLTAVYVGTEAAPRTVQFRGWAKGDMPILQLGGISDRDQAEKLRGLYLLVPLAGIHPLPDPETFYVFQVRGLAVVDLQGRHLGTVQDVEESPANDLLVVARPGRPPARVPMVRAFVVHVDLPGGQIVVNPIPGLLDEGGEG